MNKSPQSNFSLFAAGSIPKIPAYAIVQPSILTVDANISFKNILSEYPDLSNPSLISNLSITWHSPPYYYWPTSHRQALKATPKLYDAVKVNLNFFLLKALLDLPKVWSSPLHVVPKSDSATVRPVGDYDS
ncbi:hypothetical protein TNCV_2849261 [Trichonephila clavipes]|nr:hypothetical protein TNCV_2849261 [Trichonephila clavipes]